MGKFKAGDRVECLDSYAGQFTKGKIYVVSADHLGNKYESVKVERDDGGSTENGWLPEFFKLVPTITIEPGKHYRLRNGKVTGRISQGDIGFEALVDGQVKVFDKAGGAVFGGEDIVEAWVPKVGERVRFTSDCPKSWFFGPHTSNNVEGVVRLDNGQDYETASCRFEVATGDSYGIVSLSQIEPLLVAAPAQPAVWVPAVGDKVVWLEPFKASMYTKGKVYEIRDGRNGFLFLTDDNRHVVTGGHQWDANKVALYFEPAVPFKIEAGRYYKTRDGRKVGPMETFLSDMFSAVIDGTSRIFQADGTHGSQYVTNLPHLNLIAEWIDEPVAASNDNTPSTAGFTIPLVDEEPETLTLMVTADTAQAEAAFDRIIGKLERIAELQEQLGLRAA